jgi:putative redox protein
VSAYPAFGGDDAAPRPLCYALAALSSCNQVTAAVVAQDLGISLGAWSFDVGADLDTAVLVEGARGDVRSEL